LQHLNFIITQLFLNGLLGIAGGFAPQMAGVTQFGLPVMNP